MRRDNQDHVFLIPEGDLKPKQSAKVMYLALISVALLTFGLINLFSASASLPYFNNQLKHLLVIIPLFLLTAFVVPIKNINRFAWWIFGGTLLALAIVLVLGSVAGGAQRWIRLGPLSFQPSEFAKLATAIITAHFFASQRLANPYRLIDLMPILLTVGIAFVLIFLQPDFGTAGMCVLVFLCQLAFIKINKKSLMLVGLISPIITAIGWTVALLPYQKMRILNLFNPDLDPQNTGYNSLQSLIAIGSGDMFGKGFMQGTQAQLKFLPERHTDFIFSVLAEEHGFWGGCAVFAMFTFITFLGLSIAKQSKDTFGSLLAIGISAFIFLEFAINIAMVLGMFPVVGLPLPFFSYGSSHLLTIMLAIGLLISVHRDSIKQKK